MRCDQDGRSRLTLFIQEVENESFRRGVDLSCRLVRQEDARARRQGDGKPGSRQLAPRQLSWPRGPAIRDAHAPQEAFCPRLILACQKHRQLDVVVNGQGWEQIP